MNLIRKVFVIGILLLAANSQAGRWLTRDPLEHMERDPRPGFTFMIQNQRDSHLQLNLYQFVRNNPANRVDPFGLRDCPGWAEYMCEHPEHNFLAKLGECAAIAQNRLDQWRKEQPKKPDGDKWYHCVTSCEIARKCGAGAAKTFGDFREWWQNSPNTQDTARDQQANAAGRDCGDCKNKKSCEECCGDKGYSH